MNDQESDPLNSTSRWLWLGVSGLLLLVYLTFFHLCLGASYGFCVLVGIVGWLVWMSICVIAKSVFVDSFEYGIHQLVGLDVLLEGFSPMHEGFGFYYCAACFWAVLLSYRFVIVPRLKRRTPVHAN